MVRWIQAVNEPNLQEEERIWCKISVFLVSFLVFSFFIALFASIATEVDVVAVILDSSLCFQMMYTDRVRIQLHANPNSSHINCVAWFIVNMEWYISHYQTLLDIRLHIDLKYSLSTVFTKIQCSRMQECCISDPTPISHPGVNLDITAERLNHGIFSGCCWSMK